MSYTLNDIVNLHKPRGPSSFEMVRAVKSILGIKKAGHAGTLDPMAEGVLPICLNRATRIIQFLSPLAKCYTAGMVLGTATDTQDATGKVIETGSPANITKEDVLEVIKSFEGEQMQVPPMFSAKKKNGIPLYKLARNGITIDRKPALIRIHSIQLLKKEGNRVHFEVRCSSGTYVRTLCHDIGQKLGCAAHMVQLVRTRVGNFDIDRSLSPDALKTAKEDGSLPGKLFPQEEALKFLPAVSIKKEFINSISHGVAISKSSLVQVSGQIEPGTLFRVCNGDNRILAIAEPVVDQEGFNLLSDQETAFKLKRVLC